jgi:hypothetical protein
LFWNRKSREQFDIIAIAPDASFTAIIGRQLAGFLVFMIVPKYGQEESKDRGIIIVLTGAIKIAGRFLSLTSAASTVFLPHG